MYKRYGKPKINLVIVHLPISRQVLEELEGDTVLYEKVQAMLDQHECDSGGTNECYFSEDLYISFVCKRNEVSKCADEFCAVIDHYFDSKVKNNVII